MRCAGWSERMGRERREVSGWGRVFEFFLLG